MEAICPRVADAAFFSCLPAPVRFYIIRHGQSEANARKIVQGRRDFPLDDSGRLQAAALGSWLAPTGIETILSSPLKRASETAAILALALGLPDPVILDNLAEIDVGSFSGLSLDEARIRFPEIHAEFERSSWEGVPDAERAADLYERAMDVWKVLRERALAGASRVACVTHGGLIQWLFRATFGWRAWMPLVPTWNCGVFELLVEPVAAGAGKPAGARVYWERINFQAPSPVEGIAPVF
jgi:broad specificity phosphatase PhoE